jgi:hypothetical protein
MTASTFVLGAGCWSGPEATVDDGAPLETSADLVISQVYGGGGNSGATFKFDFVELFNRGHGPVKLEGKSLQYVAGAYAFSATQNVVALDPSVTLQSGQYFLVKLKAGNGDAPDLPVAADQTPDDQSSINLGAKSGKLALVDSSSLLDGCGTSDGGVNCTDGKWIDLVGYGAAASQFEGSGPTADLSNVTAAFRNGGGCDDSGSNQDDFGTPATPAPRNSHSALNPCTTAATDAGGDGGREASLDGSSHESGPRDAGSHDDGGSGVRDGGRDDGGKDGGKHPRADASNTGDDDDDAQATNAGADETTKHPPRAALRPGT